MNLERKEAELVLNALDVFVRQGGIQVAGDAFQVGLKVQDYLLELGEQSEEQSKKGAQEEQEAQEA